MRTYILILLVVELKFSVKVLLRPIKMCLKVMNIWDTVSLLQLPLSYKQQRNGSQNLTWACRPFLHTKPNRLPLMVKVSWLWMLLCTYYHVDRGSPITSACMFVKQPLLQLVLDALRELRFRQGQSAMRQDRSKFRAAFPTLAVQRLDVLSRRSS